MPFKMRTLGEVCEFSRGLTYKKSDEVDHSRNAVLRANNVTLETGEINFDEVKYISEEIEVPPSKKVKKGTLLICTASGSKKHLGKVGYIADDIDYAFGGFMGLLTPKACIYPKYLYWLTQSKGYSDFIMGLTDGANINNLKFSQLTEFPVPIPEFDEQKRIVAILDQAFVDIDKARALTEQNLKNARELFESYLQKVFSQRGEGWAVEPLENLVSEDCSLSYGIVQPGEDVDGGLPVIRPTDLTKEVIGLSGLKLIDPSKAQGYMRTELQGREILVCVRGSTGTTSIACESLAGANVTRGIVPIRFDPDKIFQRFGYYQFVSPLVQAQIKAATYGAALMQINIRDLRKISIAMPPLSLQKEIADKLDNIKPDLHKIEEIYFLKLAAFEELKKSLLQKAISGELTRDSEEVAA
ncbi:MAG: restriction endonuclease subunit S [Vibrionaceae bacterium]|nr:MAG: restriction endonuclease subunit S [Vibrionaceae bacterium]